MANSNFAQFMKKYARNRSTPEEKKAKQLYNSLLKSIKQDQITNVNEYRNKFSNFPGLFLDLETELKKHKKYRKAQALKLYDKIREKQLSHFKDKASFLPDSFFKKKYGLENNNYKNIINNAVDPYRKEAHYIVQEYESKIFKAKLSFLKKYRTGVIKTIQNPNKPFDFSKLSEDFAEKIKKIDEPYGFRFRQKYKKRALYALAPIERRLKKSVDIIRKRKK